MERRTERRKCCSHQWCPSCRKELYRKGNAFSASASSAHKLRTVSTSPLGSVNVLGSIFMFLSPFSVIRSMIAYLEANHNQKEL